MDGILFNLVNVIRLSVGYLAGECKAVQKTYPRAMILANILTICTYVIPLGLVCCMFGAIIE